MILTNQHSLENKKGSHLKGIWHYVQNQHLYWELSYTKLEMKTQLI